jgi:hypothetical protein
MMASAISLVPAALDWSQPEMKTSTLFLCLTDMYWMSPSGHCPTLGQHPIHRELSLDTMMLFMIILRHRRVHLFISPQCRFQTINYIYIASRLVISQPC